MRERLTTEIFIERSSKKHNNFYDYSETQYINNRTKVTITCPIHGNFLQNPHKHSDGQGCRVCSMKKVAENNTKTQKQYIDKVNRVHNYTYDYTKTIYVNNREKVTITCKKHGDFEQVAYSHAYGQGCPECGGISSSNSHRYNTDIFIEKSNKVHNFIYNYDKVNYINSEEKVIIRCPIHGDFTQRPADHFTHGCSKCGREGHWNRSDYIKKANGRICTFYTIRCFNENEEFYKIGITMTTTNDRYKTTIKMPYNYEIVSEMYGEAGVIWDIELKEKRKLKEFIYIPEIQFGGHKTECFTQYKK